MRNATRGWVAIALVSLIAPLPGQQPVPLPSALTPFVAVSAPIVALTHVHFVDGTGASGRTGSDGDPRRDANCLGRPLLFDANSGRRPGSSTSPTTPCCPVSLAFTNTPTSAE